MADKDEYFEFQFSGVIPDHEFDYFLEETAETIIADFEEFFTTPRVYDSDEKKFLRFAKIFMTNRPTPMRVCYSPSPLVPDLKRFYDKLCILKDMVTEYELLVGTVPFVFPRNVRHIEAHLLWTISEYWMMTSEQFAQSAACWSDDVKMAVKLVSNKMRRGNFEEVMIDQSTKQTTGLPKLMGTVTIPAGVPYMLEKEGALIGVAEINQVAKLDLDNQALCAVGRPSYDSLIAANPSFKIGMAVRVGARPTTIRCVDVEHNGRDSYLLSMLGGVELDPGLERAYRDTSLPYEYTEMIYQFPSAFANYHTVKHIPVSHLLRAIKFSMEVKPNNVWAVDSEMATHGVESVGKTDDWTAVRLSDMKLVQGKDEESFRVFIRGQHHALLLAKDPAREYSLLEVQDNEWLSGGFIGPEWVGFMDATEIVRHMWVKESSRHRHLSKMGALQVATHVLQRISGLGTSSFAKSWFYSSPTYRTVHEVDTALFRSLSLNPAKYYPTVPTPCKTYEVPWEVVKQYSMNKTLLASDHPVFPHPRGSASAALYHNDNGFLLDMVKFQVPAARWTQFRLLTPTYSFPNCPHVCCLCYICVAHVSGDSCGDYGFVRVCDFLGYPFKESAGLCPVMIDVFTHPLRNGKFIEGCAQGFEPHAVIPYSRYNESTGNMEIWDMNKNRREIIFTSNGAGAEAQASLWKRFITWRRVLDDPSYGDDQAVVDSVPDSSLEVSDWSSCVFSGLEEAISEIAGELIPDPGTGL